MRLERTFVEVKGKERKRRGDEAPVHCRTHKTICNVVGSSDSGSTGWV